MKEIYGIINKFLKDKDNYLVYTDALISLIHEEIDKLIKCERNSPRGELLLNIIYETLEFELRNICNSYEEYMLESEINGVRILEKKEYLEDYIATIHRKEDEVMETMSRILIDEINRMANVQGLYIIEGNIGGRK
ncbi:TPA: hypothetical protein KQC85_003138 [Clostridioides difficile]|nr:hypothetical protein [Clostridioides difficile]